MIKTKKNTTQSHWLKAFIEFNTKKRIKAEKMEKKIEKRCKNAIYSKTMENLRKRIDVRLVHNKQD